MIDRIVNRHELRPLLAGMLRFFSDARLSRQLT
jgi:hypothetical protein